MGKPTGFLDYAREENPAIEPLVRIENFNEFHPPLDREHRQKQGARCMNCGVPFCQSCVQLAGMYSGCPLHNLIPEWNDMIYRGNWEHALARLCKTASFPEFTGRVCPGLCMAACTCGANGDPVTVKENELALIEYGYENHLIKPRIPEIRTDKKIAVVGSGPSGMATADLLNRRGHNVTVYERFDRVGGLMMYGIPNMKLEKQYIDRRVNLMKQEGVTFVTNADIGNTIPAQELLDSYDAVVLCCGASNPRDLNNPGRDANGIYFAVDFLRANTKSLLDSNLTDGKNISAKGKHVIVVGGGDTGNDCIGTHELRLINLVFVNREILADHRCLYRCANVGKNCIAAEKPFGFGQTGDAVGTRLFVLLGDVQIREILCDDALGRRCLFDFTDKGQRVCAQCLFKRKRRAGRNRLTALLEFLQRVCLLVGKHTLLRISSKFV